MNNARWKKIGGCLILGGALLLIGATSMKSQAAFERKQERRDRCTEAALQLQTVAPGTEWKKMALEDPELCIRAGHTILRGTNGKVTE